MSANPTPDPTQQPSTGGKVRDFAQGIFQGLAGAAGNQGLYDRIAQQREQQRQQANAPQQISLAAHALAVRGLRDKLKSIDAEPMLPNGQPNPDYAKNKAAYDQTVAQIQENLMAMREIVAPDQKLPAGEWLKTHLTDRLHITNHDQRLKQLQARQQAGVKQDQQNAQAVAQGSPAPPNQFLQLEAGMRAAGFSDADIQEAKRRQAGLIQKYNPRNIIGPNGEKAVIDLNTQTIPPGWTLAGVSSAAAGLKPIASGGVTIGVTANGKPYFAKDVDDPDTPEEVKAFFASLDEGQKAKIAQKEKERQEQFAEMEKRQRTSLGAAMQRTIYQFQNALATKQAGIADAVVGKQQQQVATDMSLENRMQELLPQALAGNQQAMVGIVANHIAMTTHQPGAAMRPTKALFDEAANSQPWLQSVTKRFSPDGVLIGITLSPEQIQNMVELAPMLTQADQSALEQMQSQLSPTMNPTPAQLQPKGGKTPKKTVSGGFDWNSAPPVK